MKRILTKTLAVVAILAAINTSVAVHAQSIDSRIGKLDFELGVPTTETVAKLYDEIDFQRACQLYLWALPAVSFAQARVQGEFTNGMSDGDVVIFEGYRNRLAERIADPTLRPSLTEGRTRFTYYPGTVRVPYSSAAQIVNRSHTITADVDVPRGGAGGVLVAEGGVNGGYVLYVKDGRPTYEYNYGAQTRYKVTGSEPLAPGPSVIRMEFHYDGGGLGKGGTVALFVNGKSVGEGRLEKTAWGRFTGEDFDIGEDTGSPVSADYISPNRFTGTVKKVEIVTQPPSLSAADRETLRSMERKARLATE